MELQTVLQVSSGLGTALGNGLGSFGNGGEIRREA